MTDTQKQIELSIKEVLEELEYDFHISTEEEQEPIKPITNIKIQQKSETWQTKKP